MATRVYYIHTERIGRNMVSPGLVMCESVVYGMSKHNRQRAGHDL